MALVPKSKRRFFTNACDYMNNSDERENSPGSGQEDDSTDDDEEPSTSNCSSEQPDPIYMPCAAQNHCCTLLHGLQELRKSNTFCDYTLIAEDERIPVHRAVLASCSDYFKVMLTSNMRESREGEVELKGVTAGGLRMVVDFAYTGHLELTTDNVEEVLSAASHLQVTVAVELCSKFLEMALTALNCTDILNLAQMYSLQSTATKSRDFILENFEMVSTTEQYYMLTNVQLASMLQEDRLRVPSEYHLFNMVMRWIKRDLKERLQYLAQIMRTVRLPLLLGDELVEMVSKVDIMRSNQECSELLMQAKDYHIVVSKQPLLQSARTQVRSIHPSIIILHTQSLALYTFHVKHYGYLKDAPIPFYSPSVAVLDNFMYVMGGKYDNTNNNEIATARCFRYDPRFDSWFELASMNEARKDFVVVPYLGKLYAIGGQDENMVMCTVECYNVVTEDWEMCASMNHSCYGHAGTFFEGKIFVTGGQRFSGCSKSTICYTPVIDVWEEKANMCFGRFNHDMAEVNNSLYVIGGNIEDSYGFPVPIISMEMYSIATNQWTVCKATCNIREASIVPFKGKIYVVGGVDGEHYYSDYLQEYDPVEDKITLFDRFGSRVHGKSCCILTLPHYLSGVWSD